MSTGSIQYEITHIGSPPTNLPPRPSGKVVARVLRQSVASEETVTLWVNRLDDPSRVVPDQLDVKVIVAYIDLGIYELKLVDKPRSFMVTASSTSNDPVRFDFTA